METNPSDLVTLFGDTIRIKVSFGCFVKGEWAEYSDATFLEVLHIHEVIRNIWQDMRLCPAKNMIFSVFIDGDVTYLSVESLVITSYGGGRMLAWFKIAECDEDTLIAMGVISENDYEGEEEDDDEEEEDDDDTWWRS